MRVKEVRDVRLTAVRRRDYFIDNAPMYMVRHTFSVIFTDTSSEEQVMGVSIRAVDELDAMKQVSDREVKCRVEAFILDNYNEEINHDDIHMLLQG
jgi:hypothetical protein